MVSEKVYNTDGLINIYSSDFEIFSESHLKVYLDEIEVPQTEYDIINNSVVFETIPSEGQQLKLLVSTTPDEFLGQDVLNNTGLRTVFNISVLRTAVVTHENVQVTGYYTKGDGGQGLYYWDSESIENDDGGSIIKQDNLEIGRWKLNDKDEISVKQFGMKGDDTNEQIILNKLENLSNKVINLEGLTILVDDYPTNNKYRNGFIKLESEDKTFKTEQNDAIISDFYKTGELYNPYTGGVDETPTIGGRSTKDLSVLIASHNCNSDFYRSVNIGSIYSWAYGNVSGNYTARQCVAGAPQTVNIGSEECQAYGFRGANISSHYSETQESSVNLSARYSTATGRHSANIASVDAFAGQGAGARLRVEESNGVVTDIIIDDAGLGYLQGESITIYDREALPTVTAVATINVDVDGSITSINLATGGSGHSSHIDAVVDCNGDYSANLATISGCVTRGTGGTNISSDNSSNSGNLSTNIATNDCLIDANNSANIASSNSYVSGDNGSNLSSDGSIASGHLSVTLGSVICEASGTQSIVMGRRTKNEVIRSFAFGDGSSGDASTANRKFHMFSNGNLQTSGTITGSNTFTDYAEYFENKEFGEIKVGTIVTLDGDKVKPANGGDDILGVVSGTALIAAGDNSFTWSQRFLTDDYGRLITKDVEVIYWFENKQFKDCLLEDYKGDLPKNYEIKIETINVENPDFDPSIENVPRSERPNEWTCVGLLGQLYTDIDDTVSVGDYIQSINGIGTKSNIKTKLKVMSIKNNIAKCILV